MTLPPEPPDPVANANPEPTSAESPHTAHTTGTVNVHGPAMQNVVHSTIEKNTLINQQIVQQLLGSSGRAALLRHEFKPGALQVYWDAYEPAPEHEQIVERLNTPGAVVVLTAKQRSGRRTAAICCLFDRDRVNPLIREIQVDADVPLEVHKESVRQGEGLILNLGDSDLQDELWRTTARSLASFATALAEKQARLVVIAPCGDDTGLDPSWLIYQLSVSSPEPLDVLRTHLKVRELNEFAGQWCDEAKRRDILKGAFPEDAARLAELLKEATSSEIDPRKIFTQAVDAFTDWAEDLRAWFDDKDGHDNPAARALITSVAAVEGADLATTLTARDLLLGTFKRTYSETEDFFGPSTTTRISQVNASTSGGRVRFTKPGYGPAVLHHIWSERGRSSAKILDWMINLPRQCSLPDEALSDMVDKLIRLADRHNDLSIVDKAVATWSKDATLTRPFVEELLTRAALSTQIGSKARRKLYDLAKGSDTSGVAVAAVCGGKLARVYPDIAFVRLRRLAQHRAPEVQAAVVEAMNRVANHQWARALRESTAWVKDEASRSVGVNCLANLLSLDQHSDRITPLIADVDQIPDNDDDLVKAWSELFAVQQPGEAVPAAVATWLDTAFDTSEHRQPILRVLALAASFTQLRLSCLREWASQWSGLRYGSDRPDLEDRLDLRERLMAIAEQYSVERTLLELNPLNRGASTREGH